MMMQDKHKIPITILICDEDAEDRRRTQQTLEDAHVVNDLRFVEDGEQLLDYLQRRGAYVGETGAAPRPGLILVAFDGPPANGRAVLERIKRDTAIADIPLAILTAPRLESGGSDRLENDRLENDRLENIRLGVRAFIAKPLTFPGLIEAMNGLGHYWLEFCESTPAA